MKIPAIVTALWAIPATIALFAWSFRCVFYLWDNESSLDRITDSNNFWFIPKYSNGSLFEEASGALRGGFAIMNEPIHYTPDRIHFVAGAVLGVLCVGNLAFGNTLKTTRDTKKRPHPYAKYHKTLGWIFVYVFVINQAALGYTLFWIGMLPST